MEQPSHSDDDVGRRPTDAARGGASAVTSVPTVWRTEEDRLLTADEAAEMLQVSADRVRRLAATGQIPSVRLGHRTVRFRRSTLQGWIADKERGR